MTDFVAQDRQTRQTIEQKVANKEAAEVFARDASEALFKDRIIPERILPLYLTLTSLLLFLFFCVQNGFLLFFRILLSI